MFPHSTPTIKQINATRDAGAQRARPAMILCKIAVKLLVVLLLAFMCAATWNYDEDHNYRLDDPVTKWQTIGHDYLNENLQRAAVLLASVEGANALLSVIRHSRLSLQPAGLGAIVAAGHFLDPISNLLSRFSTVLFVVITSFSLQKLLLVISDHQSIWFLLSGVSSFLALMMFVPTGQRTWVAKIKHFALVLCLATIALRFLVLFFVVFSGWLFSAFLASEAVKNTESFSQSVEPLTSAETTLLKANSRGIKSYFSGGVMRTINAIRLAFDDLYDYTKSLIVSLLVELIFIPLLFFCCTVVFGKVYVVVFLLVIDRQSPTTKFAPHLTHERQFRLVIL